MTAASKHHSVRKIAGNILIGLVILFTIYLSAYRLHQISTVALKDIYQRMLQKELAVCGLFLFIVLDLRFGFLGKIPTLAGKIAGWTLRAAALAAAAVVLFVGGRVVMTGALANPGDVKNVIVLGLALEDGKPAPDLIRRVETAKAYGETHPDAVLILTGGNATENSLTEAAVMRELLAERGFPEERMILEDKANSTVQNFRNVGKIIDPAQPVIVVTNDYHMNRAAATARGAGFSQVHTLSAPSDPLRYGANVMWEVVSELDSLTRPAKGGAKVVH